MRQFKFLSITLSVLILVLFFGVAYILFQNLKADTIDQSLLQGKQIQTLWSFEFTDINEQNSVISYSVTFFPKTKKVTVLEIPPYYASFDAENGLVLPLHAIFRHHGIKRYRETVMKILELSSLQYLHFSREDATHFIDLIGGLEIELVGDLTHFDSIDSEGTMEYAFTVYDRTLLLDGTDTPYLISGIENRVFTSPSARIHVSANRKAFILAIFRKLRADEHIIEQDSYVKRVASITDTDLSKNNLKSFLQSVGEYEESRTYFQQVHGVIDIVSFQGENYAAMLADSGVKRLSQLLTTLSTQVETLDDEKNRLPTLTILNGTVVNGLATRTRELFERSGFVVSSVGNAESDAIQNTMIIDRIGSKENAVRVASQINAQVIITDVAALDEAGSEVTLILGSDFNGTTVDE